MNRDERLANMPVALANVMGELIEAGVEPVAVACEAAIGVRIFMGRHLSGDQASALLREQAALAECPDRSSRPATEAEHLELLDKALQFIRTLQLAGISESLAVTALNSACVLTVARTRGAAGAAAWLRGVASQTEVQAAAIDQAAKGT